MSEYSNDLKKSEFDENDIRKKIDVLKKGNTSATNDQINILSEIIIDLLLKIDYAKEDVFKGKSNGATP